MDNRPLTIFCDIDGTLVKWETLDQSTNPDFILKLLPGSLRKIMDWEAKGYNIILTTGRKECSREATEKQLARAGIVYDRLIMNIGGGVRVLINDKKPDGTITALAFSPKRDSGIEDINV